MLVSFNKCSFRAISDFARIYCRRNNIKEKNTIKLFRNSDTFQRFMRIGSMEFARNVYVELHFSFRRDGGKINVHVHRLLFGSIPIPVIDFRLNCLRYFRTRFLVLDTRRSHRVRASLPQMFRLKSDPRKKPFRFDRRPSTDARNGVRPQPPPPNIPWPVWKSKTVRNQ